MQLSNYGRHCECKKFTKSLGSANSKATLAKLRGIQIKRYAEKIKQ